MRTRGSLGMIYFLRPLCGGPIKIGISKIPERRLLQYAQWSPVPLEILATAPACMHVEQLLHDRFAAAHLHHEWFAPVPELLALVADVKRTGRIPNAPDHFDLSGHDGENNLLGVMNRLGITRGEVAERAGVTIGAVHTWIGAGFVSERAAGTVATIAAERGVTLTAADFFAESDPVKRRAYKPHEYKPRAYKPRKRKVARPAEALAVFSAAIKGMSP